MEFPVSHHAPPPSGPLTRLGDRISTLTEIILVALAGFIIVPVCLSLFGIGSKEVMNDSGLLAILMVLEATITLVLVWVFLKIHGQRFHKIGWNTGKFLREAKVGVLAVPFLFGATFVVGAVFQFFWPQFTGQGNPLLELVKTPRDLAFFLLTSLYVGGFKEEIQRAFVLVRFEDRLGGLTLGLVLWSSFFAYGHIIQGVDNAVGAGVLGLIFGLLFVWRRCVTAPIVAHALFDVITLVIYWLFIRDY